MVKCIQKDRQPRTSHVGPELISVAGNEVPGCHVQVSLGALAELPRSCGGGVSEAPSCPKRWGWGGGRTFLGDVRPTETMRWLDEAKKSLERRDVVDRTCPCTGPIVHCPRLAWPGQCRSCIDLLELRGLGQLLTAGQLRWCVCVCTCVRLCR